MMKHGACGLGGKNDIGLKCRDLGLAADFASAKKIDAAVVRDAEEPGGEVAGVVEGVELAVGLEERILHNVFAIHDGACHAGAVAVKARAQVRDGLEEG